MTAEHEPRTLKDGRYRLESVLGTGATATVWRATDTLLGVPRAVKLLSGRAASSASSRRRLLSEARAMALLDHPHVLRVLDIGAEDDRDYVVMHLASAGSAADHLDDHGPIPPDRALTWMIQVLSALHLAHRHGIIHRDVKPQNILIGDDGAALLADFGIALLTTDRLRGTRTGVAMGSMAFMAPEQRLDARSVTPSADIYATGTTLYNLLTGANPVDLFTASLDSPRFMGLPDDIATAIHRAVAHAPADRFPDARAMALHLHALLDGASDVPLPPPPDAPRLPGWGTTARRLGPDPGPPSSRPLPPADQDLGTALTFLLDNETGEPLVFADAHSRGSEVELASPRPTAAPAAAAPRDASPGDPPARDARQHDAARSPGTPTLVATDPAARTSSPSAGGPGRRWLAAAAAVIAAGAGITLAIRPRVELEPAAVTSAGTPGSERPRTVAAAAPPAAEVPPTAQHTDAAGTPAGPAAPERSAAEETTGTPAAPAALEGSAAEETTGTPAAPAAPAAPEGSAAEETTGTPVEPTPVGTAPTSSPSGAPPAASTASVAEPVGTWTGNLGANSARLRLWQAGDGLAGDLTTTNPITGVSVTIPVTARWTPDARTLVVREPTGAGADPNAGRYTVSLSEDGMRMSGRFHAYTGSRSFLVELRRSR